MKRTLAIILALMMVAAIFVGCGKKDAKDTAAGGGQTATDTAAEVHPSDKTLNVAITGEPTCWNQLCMAVQSANVALQSDQLYDRLVGYDINTGTILPNLATSWEWQDNKTLRVTLREDVTSINGDPFSAEDVVFTIQTGCAETARATYYSSLFDLENTKVVDKYVVDIAVKDPYPFLPLDLAHNAYQMSVKASVEAAGGLEATKTNPICGTGPYKLVKWDEGTSATFERREDYWGKMPYYKTLNYYFVGDANARAMGLEAGDYDIVTKPSFSACDSLGSEEDFKVEYRPNEAVVIFPLNTDREPLNVKEVRQAIALAINYEAILDIAIAGNGEITDSPYSKYNMGYSPVDSSKPNYLGIYDPEAAKEKLKEAGYPNGFHFEITYRGNDSTWVKAAEIVQNNLKAIGIDAVLNQIESAVFYTISETGAFDSLIWTQSNPNPKRLIQIVDDRYSQCNTEAGWIKQEYMDLFDKAITEPDDTIRNGYFKEINDILRDECCCIPLLHQYNATLMNSKIVNFEVDSYGSFTIESLYEADYLG